MRSFTFLALVVVAATCGPDPNARLPGSAQGTVRPPGSGGTTATGGTTVAGTGGTAGRDTVVSTGGTVGGAGGTGGKTSVATGGASGGGISGAGGDQSDASMEVKDSALPTPDVSPSCITDVVTDGYACGSVVSCSACKDNNGNSREAGCKKAIDCLASKGGSCDNNCVQNCLNQAGDTPAMKCVTDLRQAACGGSGCGTTPNAGG